MPRTDTVVCAGCGVEFHKPAKEISRQLRHDPNRVFYCTMSCYGHSAGGGNLGGSFGKGDISHFGEKRGRQRDVLSPFRYFVRKARSRKLGSDIDCLYLKALWEQQEGKCALSGIQMVLPEIESEWENIRLNPWRPSLDRINSSLGYLKGNVRFVTVMANMAKYIWTDDDVYMFCKHVHSKACSVC